MNTVQDTAPDRRDEEIALYRGILKRVYDLSTDDNVGWVQDVVNAALITGETLSKYGVLKPVEGLYDDPKT